MKTIVKIIILLISPIAFSQTIIPIENRRTTIKQEGQVYYYKDVNGAFNKFLGNWKWQDAPANPTRIVEISFFRRDMVTTGMNGYKDEIFARIKYTENGVVVYNTFPVLQPAIIKRDWNIFGGYFREPYNTNKLNCHYSEPGLGGKSGDLFLEYENVNGQERLKWRVQTFRDPARPFRMPYNMVLIKQS